MDFVDTHCHLQMSRFDEDRDAVLARSLERLAWLVVVGDDLEGSRAAIALARNRVYAAVGFHPYHAAALDADAETRLRALARQPGAVALGETGLDYFNEFCPRRLQQTAFERQLAIAAELKMPVVIHCRDAEEDVMAILKNHGGHPAALIMHCFGGGALFAEQCLAQGCYISFAGNVSYPKAATLQEAARIVPEERLLVETDAPYLAPQCVRGKRCEPWHVVHTLAFLAALRNSAEDALAAQVRGNAERAFRLPHTHKYIAGEA